MEKCIFIIDDDSVDREFFTIMFPMFGFRIQSAASPQQALRLLKEAHPDLIFIDNHIAHFNSLEIVQQIKKADEYRTINSVPIMMLSQDGTPESKVAGYEVGVEDYIIKPYKFVEVLARVKAVLRTQELTKQLVYREHRITLIESLNNSLIYFSRTLREPMTHVISRAADLLKSLTPATQSQTIDFVKEVGVQAESTIAALDALEEEVHALINKGEQIKLEEITPEMLEEKYKDHFNRYHRQYIDMQKSQDERK